MFTIGRREKYLVNYSCHRILYSNENKSIAAVHNNKDKSQKSWYTAKETRHKCTCYESIHTEYDTSKSLLLEVNRVVAHGSSGAGRGNFWDTHLLDCTKLTWLNCVIMFPFPFGMVPS